MKKNWKRVLAYVLTVAMLLGVMPDTAIVSQAEETIAEEIENEKENREEITEDTIEMESSEEVTVEENTEEEVSTEVISTEETSSKVEMTEEISTEVTTGVSTETLTSEGSTEEITTEAAAEVSTEIVTEVNTETEEITEQEVNTETIEKSTEIAPEDELLFGELEMPVLFDAGDAGQETVSENLLIYNDGTWETSKYRWYVMINNKKHYVFCLNHGMTMYSGMYYGDITEGYSGKSAFKKAVALNYFYKTNGNSWSGNKDYGPVQEVIWDYTTSSTASNLMTYANQAWKLTSLNSERSAGTDSYSSKLKGIKKSEATGTEAIKNMISGMTSDKHIIDISSSYNGTTNSFSDTISLKGRAWQYFNTGGFNGGSSDIVVDGIYTTAGEKITDGTCTATINSSGNLEVSFPSLPDKGYDESTAYTVIMHVNFDYKGADSLNYLLTADGKQNLTYDADFSTDAYFAIRVYGKIEQEKARLYINKIDEYDNFVSGCTFRLTGVQGDALTNGVDVTRTINTPTRCFEIEHSGFYKLVETGVPSDEFKLDTTEHYVYAQYDDNGQLLLYEAGIDSQGNYYGIGLPSAIPGIGIGGSGGSTSIHIGSGTSSFYYKFRNYFTSGNATLTKYANVLTKYENGKFIYEKRTLNDVGFTFFAAEDIYLNDTLVFAEGAEMLSGKGWGVDTNTDSVIGNTGVTTAHKVVIDGTLVYAEGMGNFSKYRGYTANNGTLTISDLPPGSYYCLESDLSHPGLVMTVGRYDFDVVGDQTVAINGAGGVLNEQAPADVYVYKQDENTKEYLSGAEFTLYASINNTNYDGTKLFDVSQTVDVVTARNLVTGEETIESNAWIPLQVATSNASGLAMFENIPYGDYLIAETKAPDGYELPEKTMKFKHSLPDSAAADYSSGFVYQFDFGNILSSSFAIYKNAEKAYLNTENEKNVDAYVYKEEAIEGVVFGIYAAEEITNTLGNIVYEKDDLITTSTTDEEGKASFGGAFFAGKYYFKEMQTANDNIYELDTTEYSFEVTGEESTKVLTDEAILNKQYKGSIRAVKTDGETKVTLADVEFSLFNADKKLIGSYVTDKQGEIHINNLPVGKYFLQETKTRDNYKLDDTLHEVTISKENLNQEIALTNEEYKGSIKVIKTDGETTVELPGVEFNLLDADKKVLSSHVTDINGEIYISNLSLGTYYLQETKTLENYKLDDTLHEVTISKDNLNYGIEITNEQYKGSIKVIKIDSETKIPLSNIEFKLFDSKKNMIGTFVTDIDGQFQINNLPLGNYYLQESKTIANYKLDDTMHEITISKENLNPEITITNEPYKGSIKVIKTDGKTKVPLSGVEFDLFDADKNILGNYVTDENGEIFIDNLKLGTYYIQETKTLKGYKLDEELHEVIISVEELHQVVNIKNYTNKTKITIKTDTTISGDGTVRTSDMSPIGFIMIIFLLSSLAATYLAKRKEINVVKLSVKGKKFFFVATISLGALILGGLTVKAAAELKELVSTEQENVEYNGEVYSYALQKQYETSNPDDEIVFDEEVNGLKLAEIQYETVETILQKKTLEETKDYKDLLAKDESEIADTITVDGNIYELQNVIWSDVPNMETVNYTVDYGYRTAEPTPDETYEYTYTSPVTKEENTVTLPFVRLEKGDIAWVDGFSATVTFHNLDGVYFTLGNHEFEYNPDKLSLTDNDYTELVKMLGYDTSKYRLTNIAWSGKEYRKNGQVCRDAKATGQQYAASYKAYYEDEVENGKIYTAHATYTCEVDVPAEESAPTYVMQATAYYEEASVWTNIITFVTEHKAISGALIGFFLLFIILVIVYAVSRKKSASEKMGEKRNE